MSAKGKQVQTFGRKRHAVAVAVCKEGAGVIRLNGQPLHLVEPSILRVKVMEPVLILGRDRFAGMDIRLRVKGGGHSSQVYAIRQALAKAIVSYYQKCESIAWTAALRRGKTPLPLTPRLRSQRGQPLRAGRGAASGFAGAVEALRPLCTCREERRPCCRHNRLSQSF